MRFEQDEAVRRAIEASGPAIDRELGAGASGILNRVTVSPGVIGGGLKINMLPGHCRIEVDIRLPVGLKHAAVMAQVETIVAGHPAARMNPGLDAFERAERLRSRARDGGDPQAHRARARARGARAGGQPRRDRRQALAPPRCSRPTFMAAPRTTWRRPTNGWTSKNTCTSCALACRRSPRPPISEPEMTTAGVKRFALTSDNAPAAVRAGERVFLSDLQRRRAGTGPSAAWAMPRRRLTRRSTASMRHCRRPAGRCPGHHQINHVHSSIAIAHRKPVYEAIGRRFTDVTVSRASTGLLVAGLPLPELMVQIDAEAVVAFFAECGACDGAPSR